MSKSFGIDQNKSNTVSSQMRRLARLLQLKAPDKVIMQEIAALQRELGDATSIVTVSATVEVKKG